MRAHADIRLPPRAKTVREDDQRIRAGPRRILDREHDILATLSITHHPLGDHANGRFARFTSVTRARRLIFIEQIRFGCAGNEREGKQQKVNETANHDSSDGTGVRAAAGAYWAMTTLTKTSRPPAITVPLTRSPSRIAAAAKVTSGSRYSNAATRETSTCSSAPYQNRYPRAEQPMARNSNAPHPVDENCGKIGRASCRER